MQATDWFINANQRLALTITTPDNKSLNVEETAPGEFRDFSGKGVFRSTDPALDDLRNAALAESKRRKGEAEKPAPESSRLSWGSGRGFGIVRIGGELVPESFLAAHLQKRGIDVTTDWDAAHTQSAVVPPEIEAEIAEAWKKRERPAPAPKQEIQLWEPCERCGREPSYQTPRGHLCAQCKS